MHKINKGGTEILEKIIRIQNLTQGNTQKDEEEDTRYTCINGK